ncbi:hypothetical protein DES49_2164 [Halospina denitrificans]|uniref:VanZ like protein n=1 Tax=Halospina denitrificans TaxID=332522 RepID=A0A4V6Q2K7_9GAMM|nr:hypothetical protein [Halospina denitrificans]TDT40398.1 hypothetical protein DES49_2164 [Halospina denitrificans]
MELSLFQVVKLDLVATLGLSKDALHVFVGLAVFFGAALLFRRPLDAFLPLAMVFVAAALGEMLDMRDDLLQLGHWRWQISLGDMATTVFWPLVVWGLARFRMLRVYQDPG